MANGVASMHQNQSISIFNSLKVTFQSPRFVFFLEVFIKLIKFYKQIVRLYFFLINTSIITRWAIFVLPIAGVLAIPLIVSVTTAPDAELLRVRLLWWSIWLETLWVGWWVSWAASKIIPWIAKHTVAVIVPNGKQMIDYFVRCERYLAAVGWTVACWAVFNFVVLVKFSRDHSDPSYSTLSVIAQVHAGIIICASILAGEKILIQLIAYNFHRTSYDDRIREQKFQVKVLAALYARSRDLGRSDTLDGFGKRGKEKGVKAGRVFRKAAREAKEAATNATTVSIMVSWKNSLTYPRRLVMSLLKSLEARFSNQTHQCLW